MTGIERLRKLIESYRKGNECDGIECGGLSCGECMAKNVLEPIADQIEREQDAMVKDSPYDALPPDEREAVAWVRERGGLSHVKDICHDLRAVVERLGIEWSESELHGLMDALDRRLMPEGMEWMVEAWPRFEDDAPLKFGDMALIDGEADMVEAVQLWIHGRPVIYGDNGSQQLERGERVQRPTPKVLDADGAEIREGDTVYLLPGDWCDTFPCLRYHGGEKLVVIDLHPDHSSGGIKCSGETEAWCFPQPSQLTHRAPVLAADGKPLREGETVWYVPTPNEAKECKVEELPEREKGERAVCLRALDGTVISCPTRYVTHERPDSWERLEEDAEKDRCSYFGVRYQDCGNCKQIATDCSIEKARNLVRRAKALAERDA